MALALRKAILPRNVSLLKCLKGRSFSSMNRKYPAALSKPTNKIGRLREPYRSYWHRGLSMDKRMKIPGQASATHDEPHKHSPASPYSASAHDFLSSINMNHSPSKSKTSSANDIYDTRIPPYPLSSKNAISPQKQFKATPSSPTRQMSQILEPLTIMSSVGACACPCGPCGPCGPCPSCSCGCCSPSSCNCGNLLGPPSNRPAGCVQRMNGYYYYPHGFWFCGPYHVNTGCVPTSGPISPGGPNGPVGPAGPCCGCGCGCGCCGPCGPC